MNFAQMNGFCPPGSLLLTLSTNLLKNNGCFFCKPWASLLSNNLWFQISPVVLQTVAAGLEAEARTEFPDQISVLLLCLLTAQGEGRAHLRLSAQVTCPSALPDVTDSRAHKYSQRGTSVVCWNRKDHPPGLCGTDSSVGCFAVILLLKQM